MHLLRQHLDAVMQVRFSRDSSLLVSGSADRQAIVWNVTDGMCPCRRRDGEDRACPPPVPHKPVGRLAD